ncbi:MAG: REP-associated tyrosine transposase [Sphingomonadales bacterium]|jgi:putative transposase|nr:REP-associated tyrosine transposase [Sphingomonadales bacterium]
MPMPRPPRLVVPDQPHHVTQRGQSRHAVFFSEEDYAFYLALLRHWCGKNGVAVWAWCLMPNHVHLILVPPAEDRLARALGPLHRRYALEANRRHGWTGHLWQDRFASFPLDEARLYASFRYVELNPVRARLAARPEDWRWSSARGHLGLAGDRLVDPAPARARIEDWRAFLDEGLDPDDHADLRLAERIGRLPPADPQAESD